MAAPRKYPEELRERAIRMAVDLRRVCDPATRTGALRRRFYAPVIAGDQDAATELVRRHFGGVACGSWLEHIESAAQGAEQAPSARLRPGPRFDRPRERIRHTAGPAWTQKTPAVPWLARPGGRGPLD